jgi:hypothetical protein
MSETNGQGESRLDRIERMKERIAESHEEFNREHKLLLTAQVLMTDTMRRLDLKMLETTEKLNALLRLVDGPTSGTA